MKIFGTRKNEVSKCPIDFFSIGHFIFGHITYIIIFLLGFFLHIPKMIEHNLIIIAIISVCWEIIENNIINEKILKIKPETQINSQFDNLFVIMGAILGAYTLFYTNMFLFFLLSFFQLSTENFFFFICKKLTDDR